MKRWTEEDKIVLARCYNRLPIEDLARILDSTPYAIRQQAKRLGVNTPRQAKMPPIVGDQVCLIPLHGRKYPGMHSAISRSQLDRVAEHRWYPAKRKSDGFYAKSRIDGEWVYLHRFIMPAPPGYEIDHRDGDGLNNKDDNLRLATRSQNMANRLSENVKGVYRRGKRFYARVGQRRLGGFATEHEASLAYNEAALSLYGEFAKLNPV